MAGCRECDVGERILQQSLRYTSQGPIWGAFEQVFLWREKDGGVQLWLPVFPKGEDWRFKVSLPSGFLEFPGSQISPSGLPRPPAAVRPDAGGRARVPGAPRCPLLPHRRAV